MAVGQREPLPGSDEPVFTVIVATYARGAQIAPTLASIADQTYQSFEVVVVSDGVAADGLEAAVSAHDRRFTLLETQERVGSQAGPNNEGWARARGHYVAYLGHDDIWHPDHLRHLAEAFAARPEAHVVVAGCVWLGPPGLEDSLTWVTGMFEPGDRSVPVHHFFPPSSLAHRRDLPHGRSVWPHPATTRRAVDSQFLLDAVEAGAVVESTGVITVVKFTAGHRYLSYLDTTTDEQWRVLALLRDPTAADAFVAAGVRAAVVHRRYMTTYHLVDGHLAPGELLAITSAVRGVTLGEVTTLTEPIHLPPHRNFSGWDWYPVQLRDGHVVRWSGPNPRPRLFLPVASGDAATIRLQFAEVADPAVLADLSVLVNSREVACRITAQADGSIVVEVTAALLADQGSLVELRTATTVAQRHEDGERRVGLCLAGIHVVPVSVGGLG